MLGWALLFFIVAIVAAVFGFGGIATASAGIAKILFVVFLILLLVSLIAHVVRGRRPPLQVGKREVLEAFDAALADIDEEPIKPILAAQRTVVAGLKKQTEAAREKL